MIGLTDDTSDPLLLPKLDINRKLKSKESKAIMSVLRCTILCDIDNLRVHVDPSPNKPSLHLHVYDPCSSMHIAFLLQLFKELSSHSSMFVQSNPVPLNPLRHSHV